MYTPQVLFFYERATPHWSKSITQCPKVKTLKFDAKQQSEFRHYTDNISQSRIFTHKLSLTLKAENCVFNVSYITDRYKVYANLYRMIGNLWAPSLKVSVNPIFVHIKI